MRRRALTSGAAVVAVLLTACGAPSRPTVTVTVAGRTETLSPTQLCLDDAAEFYDDATRPVLRVAAGQRISIDVSPDLAESGWQVQVFDRELQTKLGQVDAGNGTSFDQFTTSDPLPAAYFLVVVQDAGQGCEGLAGAWPVGFVRESDLDATGTPTPAATTPAPTSGGPTSAAPTS